MITFEPSNSKPHAEAALFVKQRREGDDNGMLWTERRGESLHSYIKGVYWRFVLTFWNFPHIQQSKTKWRSMFFGDVLYPSLCAVLTQILYPDVRRAQGWCIYTHQRGAWTCLLWLLGLVERPQNVEQATVELPLFLLMKVWFRIR